MSQSWTDDVYASGHVGDTDLQNMENNFAALKSTFSGATAPSNPVAGIFWYDTTAHILKQRNEANNAWLNIYDLANSRVFDSERVGNILLSGLVQTSRQIIAGTGLSGGGTLAADRTINHTAHTGDVTGSTALTIGAAKVSQSKLKTTTAEGSAGIPKSSTREITLPGGDYGLVGIKVKGETTDINFVNFSYSSVPASYAIIKAQFSNTNVSQSRMAYVQQRYVQASGEVFWYMAMRDKVTKKVIAQFCAPDHPCMMQGISPEDYPHPWVGEFDPEIHELIVCNPDAAELENIRIARTVSKKTILETIEQDYDIDEQSKPLWPDKEVTVALPPDWDEAWRKDELVQPIRKIIPQPAHILCRSLKRK